MFNGIIKNTGTIKKIDSKNNDFIIHIKSKMKFSKDEIGSSISCSGACLTLIKKNKTPKPIMNDPIVSTMFHNSNPKPGL